MREITGKASSCKCRKGDINGEKRNGNSEILEKSMLQ